MVTVVILSLNPPKGLLEDLENQSFKDFEILVASEKGIVNAMNKALDRAKGEIFVRIDDDVHLPKDWLQELIQPFNDPNVAGVTGPTFVRPELRKNRDSIRWAENPKGILRWLYDGNKFKPGGIRECGVVSYDSNYRERFGLRHFVKRFYPDHLEGTNWAMRTSLIRAVGGFDPKFDGVAEWFDSDVEAKILKRNWFNGHMIGRPLLVYNSWAFLYHNLGFGGHHSERFEGFGRIKNFLRYHWRHARWRFLKLKFYVFLIIWGGYFVWKFFQKSR